MLHILRAFLVIVPMVLLVGSAIIVAGLLHVPRALIDGLMRLFSRSVLFGTGARLKPVQWNTSVESLPHQMVLVANHESHLDTQLVVAQLSQRSIRFVGKKSLFRIPIFGWALWAAGNVPVTRGDTRKDIGRLSDEKARQKDRDVMFFPEGTRSMDGSLGAFKKGAFAFALLHRRPILPIGIAGTRECLPSHSVRPRPGPVIMVVGQPIEVEGMTYEDREALRERAAEAVSQLRQQAQELLNSA